MPSTLFGTSSWRRSTSAMGASSSGTGSVTSASSATSSFTRSAQGHAMVTRSPILSFQSAFSCSGPIRLTMSGFAKLAGIVFEGTGRKLLHLYIVSRENSKRNIPQFHRLYVVRTYRYEAGPRNRLLLPPQHLQQKFLHPCCANLPPSLSSNDGSGLELKLDKKKRRTSGCKICNNASYSRGVKGWAYASSCGRFIYHVACVNRRMDEEWQRKSSKKPGKGKKKALQIGLEAAANLAPNLIVSVILGFHSIPLGGLVRSLLDEN